MSVSKFSRVGRGGFGNVFRNRDVDVDIDLDVDVDIDVGVDEMYSAQCQVMCCKALKYIQTS